MTKRAHPWFKFYPADYFNATRGLSAEERGVYADIIVMQMMYAGNTPDDPKWMAHQMHISTRKWTTIRHRLIEHGKIKSEGGMIIQDRCLRELDELLEKRKNIGNAAVAREAGKRSSATNRARTELEPSSNRG